MVNFNRLVMVAALSIALIAVCSVANAAVTVKVDTVQSNGYYIGVPTLLGGEYPKYGYTYEFVSDGTYTIFGTITNDDKNNATTVHVAEGTKAMPLVSDIYNVPANGKVSFSLTCASDSSDNIAAGFIWPFPAKEQSYQMIDLKKADYVNEPDNTVHTIDYGPMSDTVAIYSGGKLTYNGLPQYSISLF